MKQLSYSAKNFNSSRHVKQILSKPLIGNFVNITLSSAHKNYQPLCKEF